VQYQGQGTLFLRYEIGMKQLSIEHVT